MIERKQVIRKAKLKYSSVTKNITEMLYLYLKNDATPEEQIPLFITTPYIHKLKEVLKHVRPKCEECNEDLKMKIEAIDIYGNKYPTAWICKCGIIEYSDKTPKEWIDILNENRE